MKRAIARAALEIAFIIFLFYSNLLMGKYEGTCGGQEQGLPWALCSIFTAKNFAIAVAAAVVGYVVVEIVRRELS
jgi:hypothetical protein